MTDADAPPLGRCVHLLVAAILVPGGLCAAAAKGPFDVNDGETSMGIAAALGSACVAAVAATAYVWARRRAPFDRDAASPDGTRDALAALAAGAGIGCYGGALYDWIAFPAEEFVTWALLPVAVAACASDGFLRGAVRLGAVHLGMEWAAHGARSLVVGRLGFVDRVTETNVSFVPWTFAGLVVCALARRVLPPFPRRERPPRADPAAPPRRA